MRYHTVLEDSSTCDFPGLLFKHLSELGSACCFPLPPQLLSPANRMISADNLMVDFKSFCCLWLSRSSCGCPSCIECAPSNMQAVSGHKRYPSAVLALGPRLLDNWLLERINKSKCQNYEPIVPRVRMIFSTTKNRANTGICFPDTRLYSFWGFCIKLKHLPFLKNHNSNPESLLLLPLAHLPSLFSPYQYPNPVSHSSLRVCRLLRFIFASFPVFATVQSVRLRGRMGRTMARSPSF